MLERSRGCNGGEPISRPTASTARSCGRLEGQDPAAARLCLFIRCQFSSCDFFICDEIHMIFKW